MKYLSLTVDSSQQGPVLQLIVIPWLQSHVRLALQIFAPPKYCDPGHHRCPEVHEESGEKDLTQFVQTEFEQQFCRLSQPGQDCLYGRTGTVTRFNELSSDCLEKSTRSEKSDSPVRGCHRKREYCHSRAC